MGFNGRWGFAPTPHPCRHPRLTMGGAPMLLQMQQSPPHRAAPPARSPLSVQNPNETGLVGRIVQLVANATT